MKLNRDNCHLLVGGHKHESIWAKINDTRNKSYWGYM